MSTSTKYVKKGTVIECSTSIAPRPTVKSAWPIPSFSSTNNSFLSLSLVAIAGQGAAGVQITSTCSLTGPVGSWTLFWMAYQGSMPSNPTWTPIVLTSLNVNITLSSVMASATFVCYLQQVTAGQTFTYTQATISTPVDPTLGLIPSVSGNLIPNWDSELGALNGISGYLVYNSPGNGYGGSNYLRSLALGNNAISEPIYTPQLINLTNKIPVFPGDSYTFTGWGMRKTAGIATIVLPQVNFYKADGITLSSGTNSIGGTDLHASTVGTWIQLQMGPSFLPNYTMVVPVDAVWMTFGIYVNSLASGEDYWFDNLIFTRVPAPATTTTQGMIKVGTGLSVASDGTLSASGGSATWGSIVGTLSSQTDLNTALNGKASLTGASFSGAVSATSFTGTLATAAQPNITSLGTLTSLAVGSITSTSTISASSFVASTGNISTTSGNISTTGGHFAVGGNANPFIAFNDTVQTWYLEGYSNRLGLSAPGHTQALYIDTSGNTTVTGTLASSIGGWNVTAGGTAGFAGAVTSPNFIISNGANLCNSWTGNGWATTLWMNNPSALSYEFVMLNAAQTKEVMMVPSGGASIIFPQPATFSSGVTGSYFTGSGAGLTNIPNSALSAALSAIGTLANASGFLKNNGSGGFSYSSSSANGTAAAWVCFDAGSSTVYSSFNVSSVTYTNNYNRTVNFTASLTDANYASTIATPNCSDAYQRPFNVASQTASSCNLSCFNVGTYSGKFGYAAFR